MAMRRLRKNRRRVLLPLAAASLYNTEVVAPGRPVVGCVRNLRRALLAGVDSSALDGKPG
jgi:hypothetical protein